MPVLVLGVEHSGTSILYNMIARHPSTTWFSQYSTRVGDVSDAWSVAPWRWLDRAGRRFADHDWRKMVSGLRARLAPASHRRMGDLGATTSSVTHRPRSGAMPLLSTMVDTFCTRVHRPVFVGKSPRLLRKLDVLQRMEPTPKGVHIVRDGRAVAVSLRNRLAAGDPDEEAWPKVAVVLGQQPRPSAAVQSSVDVLVVRYEDLCTDVHGTLTRVFRHMGLTALGGGARPAAAAAPVAEPAADCRTSHPPSSTAWSTSRLAISTSSATSRGYGTGLRSADR